ncbi:prolyl oligopeptidase family protein [Hephaestia sp. GCM10023244]|uniref:prolyl oligopeptidase family serine peptidase n=1 Tax=unclassified Hephaestia TaxID=2631281 RepID=UPI0020777F81|nr:prolyl oligopeptidase family serine peptidase [Hephaestia sp. MAHUQ-44]MCM8732497.1 prolyl oligopeptidase family serine peptidase [Hephaestia sp. MAHUQ-44]
MSQANYPATERDDLVEELFGHRVPDPYRWLEGDVRSDHDVARWVNAQNAVTQRYLATLPGRDVFRERLAALLSYDQFTPPSKRGGRYFFTRTQGRDNQPTLRMKESSDTCDRVLIDPNSWSGDGADALAEWAASDDGTRIAYCVQSGGTDWRTIRILDVASGIVLEDEVRWARHTNLVWTRDGSGFFYSRYPEAEAGKPASAEILGHAVFFHAVGSAQEEDLLIHSDPDRPSVLHLADRSHDGRHLLIYSTPAVGVNALAVIDLTGADWTPRSLIDGLDAEWTVIGTTGRLLYAMTSDRAARRRIVSLDLTLQDPAPCEIVAEDEAVLTGASLLGGRLLATYLVDAKTEIRRFKPDGTPDGTVALPGVGSAGSFHGDEQDNEAFFIYSSFDTPMTVIRYDVAANRSEVWAKVEMSATPRRISVEQRFYASKDGTRVPVSIIRRTDVTHPAPTLLYGYGGFGTSIVPYYSAVHLAWVEMGGVFAVANVRGGGEYGRAWHMEGQFEKRQNAFDDFAAAGAFLKTEGITSADGLAIQGESNGGLLVAAVVNQHPGLFAAALPGVGVMDMLRFHRFTGGALWMSDFGNPDEEEHFNTLLRYSPYHNIQAGEDYPAILATTADTDDRVVPGHSFKYIAALQASHTGSKPKLVRVETRAGHGAGMPLDKVIALHADMWAFAAHWTGLDVEAAAENEIEF